MGIICLMSVKAINEDKSCLKPREAKNDFNFWLDEEILMTTYFQFLIAFRHQLRADNKKDWPQVTLLSRNCDAGDRTSSSSSLSSSSSSWRNWRHFRPTRRFKVFRNCFHFVVKLLSGSIPTKHFVSFEQLNGTFIWLEGDSMNQKIKYWKKKLLCQWPFQQVAAPGLARGLRRGFWNS